MNRNAARRQSSAGLRSGASPTSLSDHASATWTPFKTYAWPPLRHPKLASIKPYCDRVFAAEVVRRTRLQHSSDVVAAGAYLEAYGRWAAEPVSDDAVRARARALLERPAIASVVRSLLDERR